MPEASQQVEYENVTADEINLLKAKIGKVSEKISFVRLKHEFRQKLLNSNIRKLKGEITDKKIVLDQADTKVQNSSVALKQLAAEYVKKGFIK